MPGNRLVGAARSLTAALRAGGPGSDAPAPRRFAARLPVRVSRAYARDGQANGLRTNPRRAIANYDLPRAARVSR